jgi:hypothetical protein
MPSLSGTLSATIAGFGASINSPPGEAFTGGRHQVPESSAQAVGKVDLHLHALGYDAIGLPLSDNPSDRKGHFPHLFL